MTDPIKAKIIELCPDIVDEHSLNCQMDESHGYVLKHKDCISTERISFAIVLRAIANRTDERCITVSCFGQFHEELHEEDEWDTQPLHHHWNLLKDYDDQEQATKDFIGSLLGI